MHILDLPDDIMVRIFSLVTPYHQSAWLEAKPAFLLPGTELSKLGATNQGNATSDSARALAFSQVCRAWRHAALADSRLWSFVDCVRPQLALEMFRRHADTPVDVRWVEAGPSSSDTLKAVQKHLSFSRSLHLDGSLVPGRLLLQLLQGVKPSLHRLEALYIRAWNEPRDEHVHRLPLRQFLLKTLGPLALTHLELNLRGNEVLFEEFLGVLCISPCLVYLLLHDAFRKQPVPSSSGRVLVYLGCLERVVFADFHGTIASILGHFDLPIVRSISVQHLAAEDELFGFSNPIVELEAMNTVIGLMSVTCRAVRIREVHGDMFSYISISVHASTVPGSGWQASDGVRTLDICNNAQDYTWYRVSMKQAMACMVHSNLSTAAITYLEIVDAITEVDDFEPTFTPPTTNDWLGFLLARPLVRIIVVTESPARTLLRALEEYPASRLTPDLATVVMCDTFLQSDQMPTMPSLLESALRARRRMHRPIPVVTLRQLIDTPEILQFEATAASWDLETRVIRTREMEMPFSPTSEA